MPTYEYLCEECGHQFDAFQGINDDPLTECPICHGHVRRLISGGNGLIFKGSGFYITDYKNNGNNNKKSKPEEKSESTKKAESTTPKSDSK